MNKGELCAAVMALHENVMGAFYVRDGRLAQWRMKEGLALPAPEKVATGERRRSASWTAARASSLRVCSSRPRRP